MNKNKNYSVWYTFSLCLFLVAAAVHLTGYMTNVLYVVAWVLWMPVIALAVITVFDVKNSNANEKNKIFSKESVKGFTFVILVLTAIYVVFNLVYGMTVLSEVTDIQTAEGIYYAVSADNKMTEIGYNEYVKYSLASFRLLSGHMLVFIAAPLWYYGEKKKMR